MTVVVKKIGGSVAVGIPKGIARDLGLSDGTPLDISTSTNAIVMRKAGKRQRRPLKQLVAQINRASYRKRRQELPDGGPVGKEIW
jgi:antitoxin component of MazEF toxin-antitoxin module